MQDFYTFFNPDTEQFDDQDTYELIGRGENLGLFQIETVPMINFCKKFKPSNLDDLSSVLAIIRPDTMAYIPDILKNKERPEEITYIHPDMKSILESTHGVLLYQEQLIEIVKKFGGFTGGQADLFRRCVDENSLILMADGTRKKIKDINVGEMVLSVTKNNIITPKKVINVFNNGEKETVKINTVHGLSLEGTLNHKVLTQDGYKEIGELTTKDYIMTPSKIHPETDHILSKYKPNSESMFLFGMLIGDGTLGGKSISFTNSDPKVIEKFKEGINSLSKSLSKCTFNTYFQYGKTVDKIYSVCVSNKMYSECLKRNLRKFDMLHKAGNKNVPIQFMKYSPSLLLSSFIAGLFNTDGGYNTQNSSLEYYSISKNLVYSIKSLLLKYGIYSYIQEKPVEKYKYNSYTLTINNNSSLIKFKEIFLPLMVGIKAIEFENIINWSCSSSFSYDYLLPQKYYEEIYNNSKERNFSDREIGENIGGYARGGFKLSLNSKITNTKALEIIQTVFAPETYDLLHAEYFPLQIKNIEKNGVKHVYDLEIEDSHNYIANDIIVHNCIGKKNKEEVKKWADLFLKQGVDLGYPSSVIQTLYDDLSAKGGYLFNKSHSIAYAQLSYFTAYLKTHYPIQFMTSVLSNQKKDDGACDYESLSKYLSECRRMGIKVTPPDINKSELWFSIIDNNINFGIGLVKGVGQKELENIIDNRPYTSFEDYLVRCSCDKTSTIALIKCGAFDSFNTNKIGLMKQFYSWRYINCKESQNPLTKLNATILTNLLDNGFIEHSDTEIVKKVLKAKDPNKVLTIANERRKNIFVESQMEEYNIKDELAWQFETMNTYLNKTPFTDICLPDWDLVDPSSSRNSYDNAAWIGGTVTAINKKVGKSGRSIGKPFAFVSLDTIYGKIEVTFFSKEYEKYVDLLERGNCLVCYGRKDGDYSMVVIDVYPLELYVERMGT